MHVESYSHETVIRAEKLQAQLRQWRRQFHMHPELSFQEKETAQFVARTLEQIPGMKVALGMGCETAVVGTLTNGSGPTIAVRADMDALPITEENQTAYRSQNKGVMHACGHDAHTAIVLGTARIMGDIFFEKKVQGTVKFLFQPAEEKADDHGSTGAPYMVKAGVLEGVDACIALHMSPENQLGEIKLHDGYSMANVDVFKAKLMGSGGHGAYPHLGTDPVWMLGPVLHALYGIPARKVSPLETGIVSIGKVNSGFASNVIPSEVDLQGTIRSYDPAVRQVIHQAVEHALSLVKPLGGDYRLTITPEDPALYNDSAVNRLFERVIAALYPDFHVLDQPFGMGGEDFAHMTKAVPGAMFFLGCGMKDGKQRNLHTPEFDIDEQVLPVGAAIMVETVSRFLGK